MTNEQPLVTIRCGASRGKGQRCTHVMGNLYRMPEGEGWHATVRPSIPGCPKHDDLAARALRQMHRTRVQGRPWLDLLHRPVELAEFRAEFERAQRTGKPQTVWAHG